MNDGDGKKKGIRIVGQSNPFSVQIQDPTAEVIVLSPGLYEVPQTSLMDVNVIFDFADEMPPYGVSDDWWSFDKETKTVHVLLSEELRKRYVELMDKRMAGSELTRDEEIEIEDAEVIMQTVPRSAAEKALMKYYELLKDNKGNTVAAPKQDGTDKSPKKEYRTMAKAGDISEVPSKMPIITNQMYKNAITYNDDETAYIQPLKSADNLVFENDTLFFEGLPASAAQLKHLYTKDNIEDFDLPLLRVFYATILNRYMKTISEDNTIEEVITIYYPQLARQLGKSSNISRMDVETTINDILSFRNILGITEKGQNILPVLVYLGEDREKNTISFASPYMTKIVKDLYKASIRRNKKTGAAILKKDGTPLLDVAYTYLPDMSLAKEKNKSAVEIVCIVVATIESTGKDNLPHISARTIIERNQLLKRRLKNTANPSNKNKLLERAFSKAWELLVTKTDIKDKYPNMILPDTKASDFKAKWIPTMGNLDMVFEFPSESNK